MLYGGFTLLKRSSMISDAKASPSLNPANPHAFESVCITIRFSYSTSSGIKVFCMEKLMYASSISTTPGKLLSNYSTSILYRSLPVGLLGEQMKSNFVCSSTADKIPSTFSWKSPVSKTSRVSTSLIFAHTLYIP